MHTKHTLATSVVRIKIHVIVTQRLPQRMYHTKIRSRRYWKTLSYLMSSNSPSGGIKLIALSVSNLLSFTHCNKNIQNRLNTKIMRNQEISYRNLWNIFKTFKNQPGGMCSHQLQFLTCLWCFWKGKQNLENWRTQTRLSILPLSAQTFFGHIAGKIFNYWSFV